METAGWNSKRGEAVSVRGGSGKRHDAVGGKVEPFVPKTDHNPRDLRSWAKRTGFVSDHSGEAGTSGGAKFEAVGRKEGGGVSSPKNIETDPVLGRTRDSRGNEIQLQPTENEPPVLALNPDGERKVGFRGNENGSGHGVSAVAPVPEEKDEEEDVAQGEVKVNVYSEGVEQPLDGGWQGPSGLKCGLKENPGFG